MKQHQGIWLPDHEQHMIEWMTRHGEVVAGRGTYQIKKIRETLKHVRQWRKAVDIGAHVGFWAMHLQPKFREVHAFEPVKAHRECLAKNCKPDNLVVYPYALGTERGFVGIKTTPGSSGDSRVVKDGDIGMRPLDEFEMQEVDLVKIDCEGYELKVLQGAVETLKANRPVVVVEQKPHVIAQFGYLRPEAVEFLESLGARRRAEMSGDFVLSWD